jgi:four helix bundle protein
MNHNFLNLGIWKRSRILVKQVYEITRNFPDDEKFGLTSQIRRCAVSVPSNIAEGCGRGTNPQLKHFLGIAIGSLCELETQIYLAYDLSYITKNVGTELVKETTEIRKMTKSFKNSLE